MRCGTILAAIVFAALSFVGNAVAAAPDGPGPWADYVVDFHQGCAIQPPDTTTCFPVFANRSDPTAALGIAESPPGPNQNPPLGSFYSLGFSGLANGTASITLGFDNPICNVAGADLAIDIFEITTEPYPAETVQVFVSETGLPGSFVFAGTVSKDGVVGIPAPLVVANFVRLVDVSNPADFVNTTITGDAYDLDGVRALSSSCPQGKIEICKARTNGMSGRTFQFSLNGGAPISVKGGFCSGAITTQAGANRVVELQSNPPTDVTGVTTRPAARLLSTDLDNRTAIVRVVSGSTAANETMVTFTNEPAGGAFGDLKICKLTQSPTLLGRSFSFRVNGGPLISTEASSAFADPSTWICRLAGTFQAGSNVTVQEQIPAGTEVDFIDTDPASNLVDFNTDTGTAVVKITGPATIVLFDNEPIPPPQAGYIEICKDRALVGGVPDPFVVGPFVFTVSPPDGNSFEASTFAGQCTEPFQVAAGVVRVTEHPRLNHTLVEAYPVPFDRFVDVNLINGTLDVEVPVSASAADETQVHFVNRRDRAQLKVCKALGVGSGALVGQTFNFTVTSAGFPTQWPSVTVNVSPACVVVGEYPVGNDVTVVENLGHGPGEPGEFIDTTGEGTFTIHPGLNEVTVTNTARGVLQVCKAAIDFGPLPRVPVVVPTQPLFRFRLDGGGIFTVRAGTCSTPIRVTPGTHTVTELAESDYELVSISTTPPDRLLLADVPNRTATVSVPYAGNGNGETVVTFTNAVRQGQVKVCKFAPPTSSFATPFSYTVYVQTLGNAFTPLLTIPIFVGECTAFTPFFPILNADGTRKVIRVVENGTGPAAPWLVTDITVSGSRGPCISAATSCVPGGKNLATGEIDFYLGPDQNIVNYTNQNR